MLAVGSMVMYGKNGVCSVKEIVDKKIGKAVLQYYVLQPAYKSGLTFFVPVWQESELKMQQVLSADEIHALPGAAAPGPPHPLPPPWTSPSSGGPIVAQSSLS